MTPFDGLPVRRIIRAKRIMAKAATILEREAGVLKESHTVHGKWDDREECDRTAHVDYDEMMQVAKDLRGLAGRS